MKIELCEDNGFMNGGKPTLVVLLITGDDGVQRRIPYEANKTIQQLYADVTSLNNAPYIAPSQLIIKEDIAPVVRKGLESIDALPEKLKGLITNEDIVECIFVNPRDPMIEESAIPKVGRRYRVFDIRNTDVGRIYELLDDNSEFKKLIVAYANEVKLVAKRPPLRPEDRRVMRLQQTYKCDCGVINALSINDEQTKYVGTCECGRYHELDRPTPAKKEA